MRTNTRARRRRTNTLLLVGTFAIGLAMGFTLCFTFLAIAGFNFSDETTAPLEEKHSSLIIPAEPDPTPAESPKEPVPPEEETPQVDPPMEELGEGEMVLPEEEPTGEIPTLSYSSANEPATLDSLYADTSGLWPARHIILGIDGTTLDADTAAILRTYQPGGVLLEEHNIENKRQARSLILDIKSATGFGVLASDVPLIMVEQEGGIIGNPLDARPAPSPADLANVGDMDEVVRIAESYATFGAELGVSVFLAPSLDIYREDLSNPEFATQSFGGDPEAVMYLGIAFSEGVINAGLIPVAKHFPGIGTGHIDKSGQYVLQESSERALAELMYPFADVAGRKIPGVLVGHVAVPALEEQKPAPPASMSKKLISNVLRDNWSYEGVVIADDLTLHPAVGEGSLAENVVRSLAAGADAVVLLRVDAVELEAVCQALTKAVVENVITPEALARSKARLDVWHLSQAQRLGAEMSHASPPRVVRPVLQDAAASAVETPEVPATETPVLTVLGDTPQAQTQLIKHRIEKGESLDGIAKKYGVTIDDLKQWNNLKDTNIKFGYSLIVNAPLDAQEMVETPELEETIAPTEEEAPLEVVEELATPEVTEQEAVTTPAEAESGTPEEMPDTQTPVEKSGETPAPEESPLPAETTPAEESTGAEPVEDSATTDVPAPAEIADTPTEETPTPEVVETTESVPETVVEETPEEVTPDAMPEVVPASEETVTFNHEIKSGEHLTLIANKYGVSVSQIREWNKIKDDKIVSGQKLKISVAADKVPEGATILPTEEPIAATAGVETAPAPEETQAESEPEPEAAPAPEETQAEPEPELEPTPTPEEPQTEAIPEVEPAPESESEDSAAPSIAEAETPDVEAAPIPETPIEESVPETPTPDAQVETTEVPIETETVTPDATPVPEETPTPETEADAEAIPEVDLTPAPEMTPEETIPEATPAPVVPPGVVETKYKVVPGDTLFGISRKVNVPVKRIMEWNNLENGNIKSGTTLKLYGEAPAQIVEPAPSPAPIEEPPVLEPIGDPEPAPVPTEEAPAVSPVTESTGEQPPGTIRYTHTVRFEQKLEGIATAYEVSAADIMNWNGLTSPEISEGQKLLIYMPE